MKHPLEVEGYEGTLEELAEEIGKMRYDKVEEFLERLGQINSIRLQKRFMGPGIIWRKHGKSVSLT
jgi:hypothetical protein